MKMHSLKIKLTIIMAAVIAAVIGIVCALNSTLMERYYINDREKALEQSFDGLKTIVTSDNYQPEDIKDKMQEINALHNINVFVINSSWNMAYTTQGDINNTSKWMLDFMFGKDKEIIKDTDEYTISRGYDNATGLSYLVIYGTLDDGSQIFMQIIIESINESIRIFNRFVQLVGIIVLIVSIVGVYIIAGRFTSPVKELSKIAESMSEMNFNAKYTRNDRSEIGLLGKSMNTMSDKLQEKISELKAANMELQKDIENKTKTDEMRREFLSNVSHELKTPIALIQGYAEGLKEGISDDPDSMDFYCEVIMDESAKMNNMVQKLLTLNQIEFGSEPPNIERFDLKELIESVVRSNQIRTSQKNIEVDCSQLTSAYVWCDQIQMEEVVTNYISNAINHCDYDRQIRVSMTKNAKTVKVSVFNTGKNIPEEDINRIWEKFYKVDKAHTREYGGNGIGLSIVKAILDNYKTGYGAINHDNGVEFWYEFPCEE